MFCGPNRPEFTSDISNHSPTNQPRVKTWLISARSAGNTISDAGLSGPPALAALAPSNRPAAGAPPPPPPPVLSGHAASLTPY